MNNDENFSQLQSENLGRKIKEILNCDPEDFFKKYKKMKKAEEEFNAIYEPFKERLIGLYSNDSNMPATIILGGVKATYVAPSTRNIIDSKKLKEEEPDLVKKYTKHTSVKASIRLDMM